MLSEHDIEIRVRYQETDAQGRLHHANYLTYFEMGRTELLRASGFTYRSFEEEGWMLVVFEISCKYHQPAFYDDLLRLRTTIVAARGARVVHEYQVFRDDKLLAEGRSILACIDRQGRVHARPRRSRRTSIVAVILRRVLLVSYLLTILLIGLLIFLHELGHLLAAKAVGIPIARFSIGFGPVLWKRRWHDVEYCLSAIPLGGYVLPRIEDENEFMAIAARRRIAFWLGGPAANFASAALLLAMVEVALHGFSVGGTLVEPWLQTASLTGQLVAAIPAIFTHPDQLSGVVGIVAVGKSVIGDGAVAMLRFAVLLNLNLAVFNLLPIAPLDGGKIFCALLEKINPRLARLQTGFAVAGLLVLLTLMVYTTVLDIVRQAA